MTERSRRRARVRGSVPPVSRPGSVRPPGNRIRDPNRRQTWPPRYRTNVGKSRAWASPSTVQPACELLGSGTRPGEHLVCQINPRYCHHWADNREILAVPTPTSEHSVGVSPQHLAPRFESAFRQRFYEVVEGCDPVVARFGLRGCYGSIPWFIVGCSFPELNGGAVELSQPPQAKRTP